MAEDNMTLGYLMGQEGNNSGGFGGSFGEGLWAIIILAMLGFGNGVQATASGIRTRTRYATKVTTTATGGAFRLLGKICCYPTDSLTSIDGTAPAVAGGDGA